jgi:hypothetical protein
LTSFCNGRTPSSFSVVRELKKINTYVEQRVKRGWFKRLISSAIDKGKVKELRERFEDTCGLFHVSHLNSTYFVLAYLTSLFHLKTEMMMDTNHHVRLVAEEFETRFQAIEDPSSMQNLHTTALSSTGTNEGPAPAQQQHPYQQQPYGYSDQSYGYDQGHQEAGYYGYQQYPQSPGHDGGQYLQQGHGPQSYPWTQGYGTSCNQLEDLS